MKVRHALSICCLVAGGLFAASAGALTLNYSDTGNSVVFGSGFDTTCDQGVAGLLDICHTDFLTTSGSLTFNSIGNTASLLLGRIEDEESYVDPNETDDLSISISLTLADGVSHTFVFTPSVSASVAAGGTNQLLISSPLAYGSAFAFTSGGYAWTIAGRIEWTASDNSSSCDGRYWQVTGDTSSTAMTYSGYGNGYSCYRARFQLTDKQSVPEPGSLALLGLGLAGLGLSRQRRAN